MACGHHHGVPDAPMTLFTVIVATGATAAVIAFFWPDRWQARVKRAPKKSARKQRDNKEGGL
jgi:undecaprenyl pyrophosphate phosphatase UppP